MAPSVYLAFSFDESKSYRTNLLSIMQSAGMTISDCLNSSLTEIANTIQNADCSVHILSRDFGQTIDGDLNTSIAKYQLNEARKKLKQNPDFKIFIWYPPEVVAASKDEKREQFINEIRNSIERNMIFSNTASPIQLIDDIR